MSNDNNPKKMTKGQAMAVAAYCTFMGAVALVGTSPMWQESAGDWLHADGVDEVKKLSTQAAEKTALYCGDAKTAFYTYEVINSLYDNRLVYSFRPYNASSLSETLNKLAEKDIFVRSGQYRSLAETRTAAAFIKGDGETPDSLVLGTMVAHSDLTATFMEQVIATADTMKPGAALVLDFTYAKGEYEQNIVALAPGATSYKVPSPNGNPYAEDVKFTPPGPQCLRY